MDRIGKRTKTARGVMFFSLLLAAVWMLAGCVVAEHKVALQRHLYKPEIPKDVTSFYSGKTIDLNDFINNDQKTKRYAYFSADSRIAYEASVPLDYFVMDCFRDAMWMAGMQVAHESPLTHIPDLKLIIDRWTEEEFDFSIRIERDGVLKYKNQYKIKTVQVSDPKDFTAREKNAYATINQAVVAVLRDAGVKAAFR
ncbi:MAG: hypothetical protein HPY65_09810 [Syntrophaceae bacterium]|nr:hypothetical protein [Syntrophaceae bacterium]